jgi:hypothetical protein
MIHRDKPEGYAGTLGELAAERGDLRYDALGEFLRLPAAKLDADAAKDVGRGRRRLATALWDAAAGVKDATGAVQAAWTFCEPRM